MLYLPINIEIEKSFERKSSLSNEEEAEQYSEDEEMKANRLKLREEEEEKKVEKQAADVWSAPVEVEQEKSRDQDFSEFLDDLFL